jgi:drug/metabolite transporter (DMT)-like permease
LAQIVQRRSKWLTSTDHSIIRNIVSFIILLIIIRLKRIEFDLNFKKCIYLCLRGISGAVMLIVLTFSVMRIDPSDAVTILHGSIIVIAFISRIFLREKLTLSHCIAIVFSLFGILLVSKPGLFISTSNSNNITILSINNNSNTTGESDYTNNYDRFLGISAALLATVLEALIFIFVRKLAILKVNYF